MSTNRKGAREKLRAWRRQQGLTLRQAGDEFGVSFVTWSDWERRQKAPNPGHAVKLERFTEGAVTRRDWANEIRDRYLLDCEDVVETKGTSK